MADSDEPKRQIKKRLDSLKAAGVEFVPTPAEPTVGAVRVGGDLFDAVDPVPAGTDRRQELTVLAETVSGCSKCAELYSTRTRR